MGRGDGGAIADRLRRVFVGGGDGGAEVSAVDGRHGGADARGGDQAGVEEVRDELGVGAAGAAPCHSGGAGGGGGGLAYGGEAWSVVDGEDFAWILEWGVGGVTEVGEVGQEAEDRDEEVL